MADGEKGRAPFYERRAFRGTVAIVALTTALLALVGPLRGIVEELFPTTEPVSWAEVVLDTSAAMKKEFDGETRFEAATEAVAETVKELDNFGLGLRRTAVTCKGTSDQVVEMKSDHTDEVIDAARDLEPEGESSIVDAVVGGLNEFAQEPMARRGPESRQLFVFTSAVSECSDGDLAGELADVLEGAEISKASKVRLIALGATSEEKAELERFKATLGEYVDVPPEIATPQTTETLNVLANEMGTDADTANEVLEKEQEDGFYPQK